MAPDCSGKVLGYTLIVSNVFAWCLGITVFGLSVGTVKNEVFRLGIWAYLKPLWDMACADIAAGVFICAAATLGLAAVVVKKNTVHVINITILVFLFCYTLSVGIATLVIAAEKTSALKQLTVLVCVGTWGAKTNQGMVIPGVNGTLGAATNVAISTLNNVAGSQPALGPMSVFGVNPVPKTFEDCNYFNDLMTPCGALLICIAIIYIFIFALSTSLCRHDSKNKMATVKPPRNPRVEVQMQNV